MSWNPRPQWNDITHKDNESNITDYDPVNGATFYAIDTERFYVGDGTDWVQQDTWGPNPEFDSTNTQELSVTEDFDPAGSESIHFNSLPPTEYLNDGSSGSGFGAAPKSGVLLFGTGGTQGSHGEFWYYPGDNAAGTPPTEITDWSRDRSWRCYVSVNDVTEVIRFGHGLLRDGEQWIGFEFDSGSLYSVSDDSNTKNRTQIDSAPTTGAYDFRVEFVSGTRAVYYVDGTQQAEHTSNLPSGNSRSSFIFAGRAENPNSTTDARGSYQKPELVVHQ